MSGVRSSKTVNGVSYEYTTLSGKITRMTWSGNAVDIVYDDAGRPYLLRYTPSGGATQTYYYVLNLQGDVVGLMNTSMQMVVKYSYDPWGKLTGTTAMSAYVALAQANPLRYRSYCYDIETGFYYLQTRYYDPTIARFINADGYLSTGATGLLSYNMFAYCENNPIMCSDNEGNASTFATNMTDAGGTFKEEWEREAAKEDRERLAMLNQYGYYIPDGAVLVSCQVKIKQYDYTSWNRLSEKAPKYIIDLVAFLCAGEAGALAVAIDCIVAGKSLLDLWSDLVSNDRPLGTYDEYIIKVEYYMQNPLTHDWVYYIEYRDYLLIHASDNSGKAWFERP